MGGKGNTIPTAGPLTRMGWVGTCSCHLASLAEGRPVLVWDALVEALASPLCCAMALPRHGPAAPSQPRGPRASSWA